MKKYLLLTFLVTLQLMTTAQILKRISDRARQKLEQKVDQKVDKTIDSALDGHRSKKPVDSALPRSVPGEKEAVGTKAAPVEESTLKSYSKYDFVPGEKVICYEDFSQDAIGDFPDKWNTNSGGEVVTVSGETGHWLMLGKQGRFIPEYINSLPDNFTLEFDLMSNEQFSFYSAPLDLFFLNGGNSKSALDNYAVEMQKRSGVKVNFHPGDPATKAGSCFFENYEDGVRGINNTVTTTQFLGYGGKNKVRVSIWRQRQRIRVYMNEEKVFDLPRAFPANKEYNILMFQLWAAMANAEDRYLINNIKLAIGAPDTRNKLITEGKFVTHGILFDVNSDKIKPASYGVLKDIAGILTENSSVRVKIVGHTDSDGNDADNLALSKRRAASVKNALVTEFGIDASRLETDGKGKSQPVEKNDTPEGKANNRRVEFIKL